MSITSACNKAVALAVEFDTEVRFTFNDIALAALPTDRPQFLEARWRSIINAQQDAYQRSPEGRAAKAKRETEIALKQTEIDIAIATLPHILEQYDLDALVTWVADFATFSLVGVNWNPATIADQLEAAGYRDNEYTGKAPEWFTTRERLGRYIIGQVINCARVEWGHTQ